MPSIRLAQALHTFLTAQLQTGGPVRRFFRLDGFDEVTYEDLLARLRADGNTLAGQPLWVRTTAAIAGYEAYALEAGKSATWYRNHVPPGHALVLIFNRHTTDAQSLKDIYPVTESLLVTEGDGGLNTLLTDYGDALPKSLRNKLRRLQGFYIDPTDLDRFLGR